MNVLTKIFLFAILFSFRPAAATEVQTGAGLVCNSPDQLTRYVALHHKGDSPEAAIQQVNDESGLEACGIIPIVYYRGERVGEVEIEQGMAEVVKILVLAVQTPYGLRQVNPTVQYTLFSLHEQRS